MAGITNDTYSWLAIYADGEEFPEFDGPRTIGHGFAEVQAKQRRIEKLVLVHEGFPAFTVHVPLEAEPVFFRRRSVTIASGTEETSAQRTIHCIGWSYPQVSGLPDAGVYLFVFDDGSSLMTTDRQAV